MERSEVKYTKRCAIDGYLGNDREALHPLETLAGSAAVQHRGFCSVRSESRATRVFMIHAGSAAST